MNTNTLIFMAKSHAMREAALRRRKQGAELKALYSAVAIVFTGLLVATAYCLLTGRISA